MKVGVPKETLEGERRVGLVPEGVEKLRESGLEVSVESGAGRDFHPDDAYAAAGADLVREAEAIWRDCDLVAKVRAPTSVEVSRAGDGTTVVSFLQPVTQAELVKQLADAGATAISMDAIPRIARAQSMDALSSMSSVGGYKSVLIGANALGRYLPRMTTAAGTTKGSRVLVLGAGVAGLQAIATAKRLGAEVTAFDIRPEVKEQIESLGATFLERRREPAAQPAHTEAAPRERPPPRSGVGGAIDWLKDVFEVGNGAAPAGQEDGAQRSSDPAEAAEADDAGTTGTGGYAREQSEDKQERDREMVREHLRDVDLVITTALVPGRRAPVLLTTAMVEAMQPGSVVVDLAAEAGGNCELTHPGEVVQHNMIEIHGPSNLPSGLPIDSSRLYSRNVVNLLAHLVADGGLRLDFDDEITDAVCLTHGGEVRSQAAREALA